MAGEMMGLETQDDFRKILGVSLKTPTITGCLPVSIEHTVTVSGTVTVTGTVAISGTPDINLKTSSITLDVNVKNTSITVTGTVAISGTPDVNLKSSTITLDVNIKSQTSAISISGAVTITSGAVTVSTAGGTNIVLDVLTQGAYTERRSAIANNGVASGYAAKTGNDRSGKFFPRGCRGFLTTIYAYCKDAGAAGGTITVYVAPYIGAGAVASADVTVPPGSPAGWLAATFNRMWNYDSLFIWFKSSTADMQMAYDAGSPPDVWNSADAGVSWTFSLGRWHFSVSMFGETCGDVPVSGTVSLGDRSAYQYAHCTADAQVKASAGRLHTVTINSCATAGTVTIYDNTAESGTVIAIIALIAAVSPLTLTYDCLAKTGIYVGFNGAVAADITVSYI
jgi:hypothetical protein